MHLKVRLGLVGPGRAGKSSLLMALQAKNGVSELIRLDNRTVGMETVQLGGVRATVLDLAGQKEYERCMPPLSTAGPCMRLACREAQVWPSQGWRLMEAVDACWAGVWRCLCSDRMTSKCRPT